MRNKIKHLKNGLTVISCLNVSKDVEEDVYIDTVSYHEIKELDVYWKIYKNKDTLK